MNSAPAELLQLLTFAALQPSSVPPCFISQLVAKSEFGCFVFDAVRFFRSSHRARHPTVSSNKKPPCLKKIGHGGRRKRCGFVHIRVNLYPCFASFFWRRAGQKTPHTTTRICNRPKVHENLVDAQPARYVFTGFFAGIGALTHKRAPNRPCTRPRMISGAFFHPPSRNARGDFPAPRQALFSCRDARDRLAAAGLSAQFSFADFPLCRLCHRAKKSRGARTARLSISRH